MGTIHTYGDSYISEIFKQYNFSGWSDMLAKNMNMNIITHGVDGSSTTYAMKKFNETCGQIVDGDVVLFVITSTGRLHLNFQNDRPETAAWYANPIRQFDDHKHAWYFENKDHIKWLLTNYDYDSESLHFEGYRHILRNFAEKHPSVRIMTFRFSHHDVLKSGLHFPFDTKNFLEFPLELTRISRNEFDDFEYTDFIKHSVYDIRVNHLSNVNLKILSQLVQQSLESGTTDSITYDLFKQRLFEIPRTAEDYDKYVELDYIYRMPWKRNRFL
jgi:hypothetical protein